MCCLLPTQPDNIILVFFCVINHITYNWHYLILTIYQKYQNSAKHIITKNGRKKIQAPTPLQKYFFLQQPLDKLTLE